MIGGARSKSGCFTCRIRKKKCDEQRPTCQACHSRQLACYGYSTPLPDWATDKSNWEQVKNSVEAGNLRALAATRYKVTRKLRSRNDAEQPATNPFDERVNISPGDLEGEFPAVSDGLIRTLLTHARATSMSNIWQLQPDTIWWDSIMRSLAVDSESPSRLQTRLLMIFLDVIHRISHTFYQLSSSRDRSWLMNRVVNDQTLYYAVLSVSACFEHSLTQPTMINGIGICTRVRNLQSASVSRLRDEVEAYNALETNNLSEVVFEGVRIIDVILNLLNLETFSMLQGSWEMHHHAARAILNHIELSASSEDGHHNSGRSLIKDTLREASHIDERRRTFEFCITNFVWIDTVATATFGLSSYIPCAFDYVPLLETGDLRPQDVMGCQGVLEMIAETTRLEQRLTSQNTSVPAEVSPDLLLKYHSLREGLKSKLNSVENPINHELPEEIDGKGRDMIVISFIWACAALIYLEFVVSGSPLSDRGTIQPLVETCLQKLEQLPARLIMRICWPYTIAGCMSVSEAEHQRFRDIVARAMRERQAPGLCWKGLIVMEECWRLREMQGHANIGWREAMSSLNARVLLV